MPKDFFNSTINDGGGTGEDTNTEETTIDEAVLRNKVAQAALFWNGTTEGSSAHERIVAEFNQVGAWPITTGSAWCAAFATVASYEAGMGEIVPNFPTCTAQIAWFQEQGGWVGGNTYHPQIGDYCYYDWDRQNGNGADHVGIVVSVGEYGFSVCEGNKLGKNGNPDSVGVREVYYGSESVYGFGIPNYSKLSVNAIEASVSPIEYSPPTIVNWDTLMDGYSQNWLRRYRLNCGIVNMRGGDITINGITKHAGFSIGEFDGPNNPPLRISFDVEKVELEAPNNSTIRVWNLGKLHRDMLSHPGSVVSLYAGYGDTLPLITIGTVCKVVDTLSGGDLVTEIELIDKIESRGAKNTFVQYSYVGGVKARVIAEDVLKQMGIQPDTVVGLELLEGTVYPRGKTFIGLGFKALDGLCKDAGLQCTILNGFITIRKAGAESPERAVVLSAETGLIGNPKKLIETLDSVYYLRGWEVEYMMNGTIDLGTPIRLESPFIEDGVGYYEVVQLHITGDSMSGDWKCSAKLEDPNYKDHVLYNPEDWGDSSQYANVGSAWSSHRGKF